MAIFGRAYFDGATVPDGAVDRYRDELQVALSGSNTPEAVLRDEAIAVTRSITDGVRDAIRTNRNLKRLVLDQGAVPLGSWTAALDQMAEGSLSNIRRATLRMRNELEHGAVEGFPGSLMLLNTPSFTTLAGFYDVIFTCASERGVLAD